MKKIMLLLLSMLLCEPCFAREAKRHALKNHNSPVQGDTGTMLKDLYHRYPRKYARYEPKRIEEDPFK